MRQNASGNAAFAIKCFAAIWPGQRGDLLGTHLLFESLYSGSFLPSHVHFIKGSSLWQYHSAHSCSCVITRMVFSLLNLRSYRLLCLAQTFSINDRAPLRNVMCLRIYPFRSLTPCRSSRQSCSRLYLFYSFTPPIKKNRVLYDPLWSVQASVWQVQFCRTQVQFTTAQYSS